MRIDFARPYILILIPFFIGGLFLSMRFLRAYDFRRKLGQTIIRSLLVTLLLLAASGMSIRLNDDRIATIFVVDGSDSLKNNQADITRFINDALKTKTKNDYVGIVAFGKTAAVENFLSKEAAYTGISSSIDASATNLENAVNMALSMYPDGYAKRLVLISDGNENLGRLTETVADVSLSGCELLTYSLTAEQSDEVYIKDLRVPESVGIGESFSIYVDVESNVSTQAIVSLYLGRSLRGQKSVQLNVGSNHLTFSDTQSDAGLKTYQVTIEAARDTVSLNNEYSAYTNISKSDPLLLVEGIPEEGDTLAGLLRALNKPFTKITPDAVPDNLSELLQYGGVILVNTSADRLNRNFLDLIEAYVKDYGKGMLVCGGRQAFAMGGYKDTPLETVLPVEMDIQGEKEIPKMAIQIIIDKSGSMSGENLEMAKQAAIAAVENMRDTDSVGVMSFDDKYTRVVPIQAITDRSYIRKAISSIQIEGGTSIYPALEAATRDIANADAAIKHIILLTDGQDGYEQFHYSRLLKTISEQSITLSTVAIGSGCNTDLLTYLAQSCNGRMYQTDIGADIPRIFTQEVYLAANTYIVEEDFSPIVLSNGGMSDDLISGLYEGGLPELHAYVATTIKPRATEVLTSPEDDPVLAWWQYGLGKTLVWTSDATAQWSGNFFGWEGNTQLWSNMINLVTQDVRVDGSFAEISQTAEGAHITYHTEEFGANTSVSATVIDSSGNTSLVSLPATAPGVFEGSFPMEGTGVYSVAISQYLGEELQGGLTTAAIKKYSPEYVFDFKNSGNLLEDYTVRTGGTMITGPDMIFSSMPKSVKAMTDITTPLLVIALLWFVLDIAYRRFNIRLLPEIKKKAPKVKDTSAAKAAEPSSTTHTEEVTEKVPEKAPEKPTKKPKDKDNKPKPGNAGANNVLDTSQLLNRMKK